MRPTVLHFLLVAGIVAVLISTATGKQATISGKQKLLTLTADQAEFLRHVTMVDLSDGQGGLVRTAQISGINVQVVNGLGSTNMINGAGNLIVGYNELGNLNGDNRTGSHNLVGGSRNSFSSSGGLVVGLNNTISRIYASVSGGARSVANGVSCSVSGGTRNTAKPIESCCM